MKDHHGYERNLNSRLQAVPFWIVADSREVAQNSWARKNGSERAEGGLGRGGKKKIFPASSPVSSRLFLLAPVSLRCERTLSTNQKGTACSYLSSREKKPWKTSGWIRTHDPCDNYAAQTFYQQSYPDDSELFILWL